MKNALIHYKNCLCYINSHIKSQTTYFFTCLVKYTHIAGKSVAAFKFLPNIRFKTFRALWFLFPTEKKMLYGFIVFSAQRKVQSVSFIISYNFTIKAVKDEV